MSDACHENVPIFHSATWTARRHRVTSGAERLVRVGRPPAPEHGFVQLCDRLHDVEGVMSRVATVVVFWRSAATPSENAGRHVSEPVFVGEEGWGL